MLCEVLNLPAKVPGGLAGAAVTIVPCVLSLIIYRLSLTARGRNPSSKQVDSIYYLGFLITLMVLAASAFELARNSANMSVAVSQSVGAKFALGLLVTGFGLYFRITLQSDTVTDKDAMSSLRQYADNIGLVNDRISETDRVLSGVVGRVVETAQTSARDAGREFSNLIVNELKPAVTELKTAISQMGKVLDRFKPERFAGVAEVTDALVTKFKELEDIAPVLAGSLKQLSAQVSQLATSSESLGRTAGQATTALSGASSEAVRLGDSMKPVSAEVAAFGRIVGESAKSLEPLDSVFSKAVSAGNALEARLGSTSQALVVASDAAKSFSGAVGQISTKDLERGLAAANAGLAGVVHALSTLADQVQNSKSALGQIVEASASKLKDRTQEMEGAASALGGAMTKLAQAIKEAAEEVNR